MGGGGGRGGVLLLAAMAGRHRASIRRSPDRTGYLEGRGFLGQTDPQHGPDAPSTRSGNRAGDGGAFVISESLLLASAPQRKTT